MYLMVNYLEEDGRERSKSFKPIPDEDMDFWFQRCVELDAESVSIWSEENELLKHYFKQEVNTDE